MKRQIFLALTFVFAINFLNGQSLGVQVNPNASTNTYNSTPSFGFSGGFYFDQTIYKRLGFSLGLKYTQLREAKIGVFCFACVGCPCPERVDYRSDYAEIPINIELDISRYEESKWKLFLQGGYSYAKILNENQVVYENNEKTILNITNRHGYSQLNFFNFGFVVKHDLSEKFNFAYGGQFQHAAINEGYNGLISSWNIFVRTGIKFK